MSGHDPTAERVAGDVGHEEVGDERNGELGHAPEAGKQPEQRALARPVQVRERAVEQRVGDFVILGLALVQHRHDVAAKGRLSALDEGHHGPHAIHDLVDEFLFLDGKLGFLLHPEGFQDGTLDLQAVDLDGLFLFRDFGHELRPAALAGQVRHLKPGFVGERRVDQHGSVADHVPENVAQIVRAAG